MEHENLSMMIFLQSDQEKELYFLCFLGICLQKNCYLTTFY